MFLTFLCGMQNSRPGVKISPRIEQHKLYNTFSKYLVHVSNNTESYPKKKKKYREYNGLGQAKEYSTTSNSMEA